MFDKSAKGGKPEVADVAATANRSGSGHTTTIGASVLIKGEVSGKEDLVIQGSVEGSINLKDHAVSIGEQGRIQANIFAKSITVKGELNGDMHGTERVTVSRSGKVKGNILSPRVVLEDGASFKGSIDMESKPTATASVSDVTKSKTA